MYLSTRLPERNVVEGTVADRAVLRALEQILSQVAPKNQARPRLVGSDGESIDLPDDLFKVLRRAVHILARGDAVSIVPVHAELTTQQAADMLNISRPHLVSLLESNEIPFQRTGKHRRIRLGDLLEYKRKRDEQRREQLAQLTRISEEHGLYK